MGSSWHVTAEATIAAVHDSLPADASLAERTKAVDAAYPFGERAHFPYKEWLAARRRYLVKFGYVPQELCNAAIADGKNDAAGNEDVMGNAGRKLIEGATEALAIAKGEIPAAGLFVDGHHYVPRPVWRPISEAPRDGTHIIGLSSRDGDVNRIYWGLNYYGDLRWCTSTGWRTDEEIKFWMPLPSIDWRT